MTVHMSPPWMRKMCSAHRRTGEERALASYLNDLWCHMNIVLPRRLGLHVDVDA